MEIALRNGATLVEINPAQTPVTKLAEFALTGTAGAILPQLSAAVLEPV
jgi:NAD-dependent SIR2 family protein deacetylase